MRTEKKAMMAAIRSMPEWMASEIILTEPLIIPMVTLSTISTEFEIIDKLAVLTFFRCNDLRCILYFIKFYVVLF